SEAAALQWFMRAASQGHSKAQFMLAKIWANGEGVPRNNSLSYRWAYIARTGAADDDIRGQAQALLDSLETSLPREEISDIRERTGAWKPTLEESRSVNPSTDAAALPVGEQLRSVGPRPRVPGTYQGYKKSGAIKRAIRARFWLYARLLGF